jgi:hypothetical protein
MGLDICVYKVYKPEKVEDVENAFTLKDFPELEIFKNLAFEKENEYYDIIADIKKLGYDPAELEMYSAEFGESTVFKFKVINKDETFDIVDPPTYKVMELCIAVEEVGYQRKGANSQFYEDGMWDSPCVTDLKTLKKHWKAYFSKQTPESQGGFGSGLEYELEDADRKKRFKQNIIDKFVEGETFVIYQ